MVSFLSTNSYSGRSKASKLFFDLAVAMNDGVATTRIYIINYPTINPLCVEETLCASTVDLG